MREIGLLMVKLNNLEKMKIQFAPTIDDYEDVKGTIKDTPRTIMIMKIQ